MRAFTLAFAVVLSAALLACSKKPEDTVAAYTAALKARDWEKIVAMDGEDTAYEKSDAFLYLADCTYSKPERVSIKGDMAIVSVFAKCELSEDTILINLEKVKGNWVIRSFNDASFLDLFYVLYDDEYYEEYTDMIIEKIENGILKCTNANGDTQELYEFIIADDEVEKNLEKYIGNTVNILVEKNCNEDGCNIYVTGVH